VCEEDVKMERIRTTVEAHGILLRYFHHPYLSNFMRVTVGLPEHTDLLQHALSKIETW
jgi:histidinol-phosphate aminotransferase